MHISISTHICYVDRKKKKRRGIKSSLLKIHIGREILFCNMNERNLQRKGLGFGGSEEEETKTRNGGVGMFMECSMRV